jgi:hypothetical protein
MVADHEDNKSKESSPADISENLTSHNLTCLLHWRQEEFGLSSCHVERIGV